MTDQAKLYYEAIAAYHWWWGLTESEKLKLCKEFPESQVNVVQEDPMFEFIRAFRADYLEKLS